MATVTSFKEIHNGRTGSISVTRTQTIRKYTRVFRAITDDPLDSAALIFLASPRVGETHPDDDFAWCRNVSPVNADFAKRVWIVTVSYSTAFEILENPLNDPVEISWDTEVYQRPAFQNRDGDPILNSANDPFDPLVQRDDDRWTATCRFNLPAVPTAYLAVNGSLNQDAYVIDGVSVGAEKSKVRIAIGTVQTRNDIIYRTVITKVSMRDTWQSVVNDEGFRRIGSVDNEDIRDIVTKQKVTAPVALNGSGQPLVKPTIGTYVFRSDDLYPTSDFITLFPWAFSP